MKKPSHNLHAIKTRELNKIKQRALYDFKGWSRNTVSRYDAYIFRISEDANGPDTSVTMRPPIRKIKNSSMLKISASTASSSTVFKVCFKHFYSFNQMHFQKFTAFHIG